MLEFFLAIGITVSLSLGILLWWETKKRVDLERLLNITEATLTLVRSDRDRQRRENERLFSLLKEKEDALRKVESLLAPADRFDRLFIEAAKSRDDNHE